MSPLTRDKGGKVTKRVGELLTEIPGVKVFSLKKTLKLSDGPEDPLSKLAAAVEEGLAWIKEEGADILIWGEVAKDGEGLTLRLLPAPGAGSGGEMGSSGFGETLELPSQFDSDMDPLFTALVHSNVAATLDAKKHANEWCSAQTSLGRVLYILTGVEAKPEYLQTAIAAYEQALEACDKNGAPSRWAEVTNQYGVVLLAMGEELGGEALEQAASKFCEAIRVYRRETAPVLWAQTANNLGAACFALAKKNSQNSLLREVSDYFKGAMEVYRQQGVPKQAEVIEKNLQRVKRLLISRGG